MLSDAEFWAAYDDPRWQLRREEVIEAAGYTCRACGAMGYWCPACERRGPFHPTCDGCRRPVDALQGHHRRYVAGRKPWEYPDGDLLCLCVPCHERATVLIRRARRACDSLAADAGVDDRVRAAAREARRHLGLLDADELPETVRRLESLVPSVPHLLDWASPVGDDAPAREVA